MWVVFNNCVFFREFFSNVATVWVNNIAFFISEQLLLDQLINIITVQCIYIKKDFDALVQRRVEDITDKFELIHPDLLSNLSDLIKNLSVKL